VSFFILVLLLDFTVGRSTLEELSEEVSTIEVFVAEEFSIQDVELSVP
jgi:hypothetical protein